MSKRLAFRVFTAVLILFVSAAAPAISVKREMVPMRDGTKLATDIGLPDGDRPWPTIMIRTPYS
jgi:predicted acyl esterase